MWYRNFIGEILQNLIMIMVSQIGQRQDFQIMFCLLLAPEGVRRLSETTIYHGPWAMADLQQVQS